MSTWCAFKAGLAFAVFASVAWPDYSYSGSRVHSSHLYVFLGLNNNSPGLSEFGGRMARRGVPTTVVNHSYGPALAREAIQHYKSGQLRSIMIIGHSLGGAAAVEMAAELGRSGVPVDLVVTLDPVGASVVSTNVRQAVNIRPRPGEDHFSVIAAHERDLTEYVLGESSGAGSVTRRRPVPP
jgi:hypothetical protein